MQGRKEEGHPRRKDFLSWYSPNSHEQSNIGSKGLSPINIYAPVEGRFQGTPYHYTKGLYLDKRVWLLTAEFTSSACKAQLLSLSLKNKSVSKGNKVAMFAQNLHVSYPIP